MPFNLLITGTFFEERHALSVEAGDVDEFVSAIRSACGLDGVACSIQYEDPDFNEWCEVDDLDDLDAGGQITIRLKAPPGTVLTLAAPGAAAPLSAPPPADDFGDEFTGPTILETTKSIDFTSRDYEQFTPAVAPAAAMPVPAMAAAAPAPMAGGRQLQLSVTESAEWCPEGTMCAVMCADLAGLSLAIGRQFGLMGVKVEIFDEEFEEWCGAATLDEVPDRATVRIKATGRGAPVAEGVLEPEPKPEQQLTLTGSVYKTPFEHSSDSDEDDGSEPEPEPEPEPELVGPAAAAAMAGGGASPNLSAHALARVKVSAGLAVATTSSAKHPPKLAEAIKAFPSQQEGYLSLGVGHRVVVTKYDPSRNWWHGYM